MISNVFLWFTHAMNIQFYNKCSQIADNHKYSKIPVSHYKDTLFLKLKAKSRWYVATACVTRSNKFRITNTVKCL